ncbi:MAG TPA: PhnD/SsuA/transferrin family substrate-binding protein [Candidatus Deferrimicrobiaceae bacterium]
MKWMTVAFTILLASASGAAERQSLAVVPYYAPEKMWQLFSPLADYLTRKTGTAWELKLYPDQESLVHGIGKGEVAVAFLGPVPFGRVSKKTRLRPLLVARAADGYPWYRSVLVTTDPAVRTLKDIRGRSFGFFEGSTAAHVVPRRMLEDAGVAAGTYRAVFLKGQDRIVDALLKREIAGAGIKLALYDKFRSMGLVALLRSDRLPNFCFSATSALSPADEKNFVAALLSLKAESGGPDHELLRKLDDEIRHGFVPPPPGYAEAASKLADDYAAFTSR